MSHIHFYYYFLIFTKKNFDSHNIRHWIQIWGFLWGIDMRQRKKYFVSGYEKIFKKRSEKKNKFKHFKSLTAQVIEHIRDRSENWWQEFFLFFSFLGPSCESNIALVVIFQVFDFFIIAYTNKKIVPQKIFFLLSGLLFSHSISWRIFNWNWEEWREKK